MIIDDPEKVADFVKQVSRDMYKDGYNSALDVVSGVLGVRS